MYTSTKEYTIGPQCPWYKEQQSYGPPNVNWCEPTQCAWINEPANAWSNLGYLLVGILIIQKLNRAKETVIRDFGIAVFLTGLFSFTYHASNNYFSQFFDFLGMYLFTSLPLAIQIQRLRGKDPRQYHALFWFFMFFGTCLFWFFTLWKVAIQHTIILQTIGILVLEILCKVKEGKKTEMKFFALAGVFFFVAQVLSQLDLKRVWCEPGNVFLHGHALWHLTSAVGMIFLAIHYRAVLKDVRRD